MSDKEETKYLYGILASSRAPRKDRWLRVKYENAEELKTFINNMALKTGIEYSIFKADCDTPGEVETFVICHQLGGFPT